MSITCSTALAVSAHGRRSDRFHCMLMRVLMVWHGLQAQGLYVLPPLSQGLQPSLSDTLDVWQGVLSGAAGKLEEHYDVLDKQLKGRPSIRQSLVRAFQVARASASRVVANAMSLAHLEWLVTD